MKLSWDENGGAKLPNGTFIYVRFQSWLGNESGFLVQGWVVAVDKPIAERRGQAPWTGPNARFAWRTRRVCEETYEDREAAVAAAEDWASSMFPLHELAEVRDAD